MIQNLAFAPKSFPAAMASASNRSPPMTRRTRLKSQTQEIPFRSTKIRKITVKPAIAGENDPTRPFRDPADPVKSLSSPDEIRTAIAHLRRSDPLLINLLDSCDSPKFKSNPPFLALAKSILYQQLATKAAQSIYNRFAALCGGEAAVVPGAVLALTAEQLRAIGVSGRKASYLHDLAGKFAEGILRDSSIAEMDDETLVRTLTAVKGIGVWSVHMFMIFNLHRADVLPVGDLGVRKGVQRLHGLKALPEPMEMEKLCEKWRPYRSMGAWYMWRLMEAKEIAGKTRDFG